MSKSMHTSFFPFSKKKKSKDKKRKREEDEETQLDIVGKPPQFFLFFNFFLSRTSFIRALIPF
jgi:hypothetical protein